MANTKNKAKQPKRSNVKSKSAPIINPRRASQNAGFTLDLKAAALRDLMTEQSKAPWGYATYYTGTQAQLVKAGIPEYLFPTHSKAVALSASGHKGTLQRQGTAYELCIHWDHSGPGYAGHPAAVEIARMIHIAISEWLNHHDERGVPPEKRAFEVPTQKLRDTPQAVDYRLSAKKRFRWARNFPYSREMFHAIQRLFYEVQNAEVMPLEPVSIEYPEQDAEITATDDAAQLLARISGRSTKGGGHAQA